MLERLELQLPSCEGASCGAEEGRGGGKGERKGKRLLSKEVGRVLLLRPSRPPPSLFSNYCSNLDPHKKHKKRGCGLPQSIYSGRLCILQAQLAVDGKNPRSMTRRAAAIPTLSLLAPPVQLSCRYFCSGFS